MTRVAERPALCIVNHDGEGFLGDTLAAARRCADEVAECWLVDVGSRDGSVALARRTWPELRILELGANLGPGPGRNAGLDTTRSRRVLFVDGDVLLEPGCAARLGAALDADPRAALAMPGVLYRSEPARVQYAGAGAHYLGLMLLHAAGRPAAGLGETPYPVRSLVTACFLLDRERAGADLRFGDSFFMYFEDHDLGLRARLRGHDIVVAPGARCLHGPGTPGLALRTLGHHHPVRVEHTIRNRWQVLARVYALRTLLLLAPALALFEAAQLAGALRRGWLREWLRAAAWMVRNARRVARGRRAEQGARRRRDGEILEGGPLPLTPQLVSGPWERRAARWLGAACDANWRAVRGWL